MARPIWRGSLSFGLVNVPVQLYSATEDHAPHFNQFQRGTADRVRYKRVNERTGREVPYRDVVKGAAVSGSDYVIIDPEELDAIAPGRSRLIEISEFVSTPEIDPAYYRQTYYLAPAGDDAERAYALLRAAMDRVDRIGIATFAMRGRQYLAAIRPAGEVLVLQTLYYADELRDPAEEIDDLPGSRGLKDRELKTAVQLIDSLTEQWRPEDFSDTYREKVNELIASKRKGEEIVEEGEPPESTNVVDLMDALRASVSRAREDHPPGGTKNNRDDLADKNKDELRALAADMDVSGRSKMTRDQLADAVRQARGKRGRRKSAS